MLEIDVAIQGIQTFLKSMGHFDQNDAELEATAKRVAMTYLHDLCDGYAVEPGPMIAAQRIRGSTEIVLLRDIYITTLCPHHLLPASGMATIVFSPNEWIVGLGAMIRTLEAFAHRLTFQEQIGEQVVEVLMAHLKPYWTACRLIMRHQCLALREATQHQTQVETLAIKGTLSAEERRAIYSLVGLGT
ncbi:GTP cyclohydrolase I [Pajaroellobacter abortibovis]|uniref:GTP cyclohydrolase I n=1 Tax=Pajaroellobacter abortibovis TaxID=1882918 RepID=A0A1L6MYD8_9BACT|nr:GTP cyclohydrolase I [Pajaroellobacter abortibovis]APS00583.1 hypothetical protein BCY86_07780 [Pajaroellobacter abortibovis]